MYTWEDVIERVNSSKANSSSEVSDKRGLLWVFQYCKTHGLEDELAEMAYHAPINNLRSACSELRRAVRWECHQDIKVIIILCYQLPNAELRLKLHTVYLDTVNVLHSNGRVVVDYSPEQFERVKQAMKLKHKYSYQEEDEADFAPNPYDIYQ